MESEFGKDAEYSEEFLQESRQDMFYIVCAVFMVLQSTAVALRFVSKGIGRMKFGWDDALIILSYMLCMAIASGGIGMCAYAGKQFTESIE